MHFWGMSGHMMWMTLWWGIGIAVIVSLVWFLIMAPQPTPSRSQEDSPELILKRRYTRGEIDPAEYEQRLQDCRR